MSDNSTLKTVEENEDAPEPDPREEPKSFKRIDDILDTNDKQRVRNFDAASDDHPLVEVAGQKAVETKTTSGLGEFLSRDIYQHDNRFAREYYQNSESGILRAAKLMLRHHPDYGDEWLNHTLWLDAETGETVARSDEPRKILADFDGEITDLREITAPRLIGEVLDAARSIGYDDTIEIALHRDERLLVWKDNGIGMTPTEFWKHFNTNFESGSDIDSESGGKFGIGNQTSNLVHGTEGGMNVSNASRLADFPTGQDPEQFMAYSYMEGATALPGEPDEPDSWRGAKFEIPVKEDIDINDIHSWVKEFQDKLRVPVKYDEYDSGSNPVDEEYEATDFVDSYDDPPVVIERPGEFTVVAGPEVIDTGYRADDDDTFLVSMPIERNASTSINTFWEVVVQVHDEQGRIVMGPNRGRYRENVDELHEDDIPLPEPTGPRDTFRKDKKSQEFWPFIESIVKEEELSEIEDIAQRMKDEEHPGLAFDSLDDWKFFVKMVNHYGSYRVTDRQRKMKKFLNNHDVFPDYDDDTIKQIYALFKEIEIADFSSYSPPTKTSSRRDRKMGRLLADHDNGKVFMAASTGGNFGDRWEVAKETYPDGNCIIIPSASKYEPWSNTFGFEILKEIPLTQSDDHDWDVPDAVHESHKKTASKSVPDDVSERTLKLRTDDDNSSIDLRLTISDVKSRLEDGGKFHSHRKLILYPRNQDRNISDNYDMAKYGAIASVTGKEWDELKDYEAVVTHDEYEEWSKSALIATEEGAKTPEELLDEDRFVIVAYRPPGDKEIVKLLGDDFSKLRSLYCEDIRDQIDWARQLDGYEGGYNGDTVPDSDKPDTLLAVACSTVMGRAEYTFDQSYIAGESMTGLRLSHSKYGSGQPFRWRRLSGDTTRYRKMADTPNWDDDSDVYDLLDNAASDRAEQMFMAFHDVNIDPSKKTPEKLRELIIYGE
jgi:hypothetical protein